MNTIKIKAKRFDRQYLKENGHKVFRDRELIIESETDGQKEHSVYRYKIGDGVTPYKNLNYISSLYSVFPNIIFYDEEYQNAIEISFEE